MSGFEFPDQQEFNKILEEEQLADFEADFLLEKSGLPQPIIEQVKVCVKKMGVKDLSEVCSAAIFLLRDPQRIAKSEDTAKKYIDENLALYDDKSLLLDEELRVLPRDQARLQIESYWQEHLREQEERRKLASQLLHHLELDVRLSEKDKMELLNFLGVARQGDSFFLNEDLLNNQSEREDRINTLNQIRTRMDSSWRELIELNPIINSTLAKDLTEAGLVGTSEAARARETCYKLIMLALAKPENLKLLEKIFVDSAKNLDASERQKMRETITKAIAANPLKNVGLRDFLNDLELRDSE